MKKWYRMPRVKFFLLAAAHILAAAGVLCILWATRYPVLIQELCSADAAKTYEESNAFANAVANANYHILDEIQYQTLYDTDGNTQIKKSNENPMILSLYDTLLKGKEHELLHRNFSGK